MPLLTDILGKRSRKLNFRTKPIGFREDRKELCVVKQKTKKLKKRDPQVIYEKNPPLPLELIPTNLPNRKMVDIYHVSRFLGLPSLYRLFQISPQRHVIKKEILRFGAIGMTAVILLNMIGAYSKGLTLQKEIKAKASGAYDNLISAANSAKDQDFLGMFDGFYNTSQILAEVEEDLKNELQLQTSSGIDSPLQNITLILRAGRHLSKAGEYLSQIVYGIKQLPEDFMEQNNDAIEGIKPDLKITDKIKADSGYLSLAMTEIESAMEILNEVELEYLPKKYRGYFVELDEKLKQAQTLITMAQEYVPFVLDLLGDRYPQRYMILLQNNHESRATGGFIGSYILLDLNDGEITKFELKDVYEADGQFHEKVNPPEGLHKITENWRMRDSNYSPDFPTSAQQVMWFLEHEKGPTVDTVIAINQRVVESLLEKIGEVEVPGVDMTVNAENFSWVFSFLIEAKLAESNSPKQFLMDFVPVFKEKLLKPENIPALIEVLQESIKRKDFMAYSQDQDITMLIEQFGIDGKTTSLDETFDYLQVINTSIGGNKSDGFVNQKIRHNTNIDNEGNLINDVTITRKHMWYHAEDEIFDDLYKRFGSGKLERQELKDVIGFGGNKSLIRVYVPLGSELISATGSIAAEDVLVYEDLGKTVFAFEQPVIYTEREVEMNLNYKLPHQLDLKYADNYKLVIQNQPGQEENYFEKTVALHSDGEILEKYPKTVFKDNSKQASFDKFLEGDEYLSVVVGN